jgi:hypothetical protein
MSHLFSESCLGTFQPLLAIFLSNDITLFIMAPLSYILLFLLIDFDTVVAVSLSNQRRY